MLWTLALSACLNFAAASDDDRALGGDDCAAFDDPELMERLDRRTGSVERAGNSAELLVDGVSAFRRRRESAKAADVILVKTFIFSEDTAGRNIARQLAARARDGAVVILQYDLKGSLAPNELIGSVDLSPSMNWLRDKPMLAELVEAGVLVVPTNVPRRAPPLAGQVKRGVYELDRAAVTPLQRITGLVNFDHFDHEKYWITGRFDADGQLVYEAILGGMNLASEYAFGGTAKVDPGSERGGWRDTDVALRGPVVNDIVARYLDVLDFNLDADLPDALREALNPPQPAAGEARARFVWNQPALGNDRQVERLYRALIRATPAGGTVRIASAYFTPGRRLYRPMERHLEEGRLAVLTNSPESVDVPLVTSASRDRYTHFLKQSAHAAMYEWVPQPERGWSTLHAKTASFGTCGPAIVGSANLDGQSSEHNSESVVMIRDADFRRDVDAMFDADFEASRRYTLDDVEATSGGTRFLQHLIYTLGWRWLDG